MQGEQHQIEGREVHPFGVLAHEVGLRYFLAADGRCQIDGNAGLR